MKQNKSLKICFAASSGGHYEQLMMLYPLMKKYDSFILTEKTKYMFNDASVKTYYVRQINRDERGHLWKLAADTWSSFIIFLKERPDLVICTGALATIPMCLIMKLFGKKLIYIESFARISIPSLTGKFLYRYADQFYVQWKPLLDVYPHALYLGGIY